MRRTIAILDRLESELDTRVSGGLQRVAMGDMAALADHDFDAEFFAGGLTVPCEGVVDLKLPSFPTSNPVIRPALRLLGALRFAWRARNHDGWMLLNMSHVGLLAPARSVVIMAIPLQHQRLVAERLFRPLYKQMRFAFCSAATRNEFLIEYPWMETCSEVIHNGVELTSDHLAPRNPNDRLRFLFAACWTQAKGIHDLIAATRILKHRANEFELWLAGSANLWQHGLDERQAVRHTREEIDEELRSLTNVRVLGEVAHDDLIELMKDVDVLVSPSVWEEPFGLINVEAMTCGTAVIASRVGGIPEIVVDGETGFLISPGDPEGLARVMERSIDNRDETRRMGERGFQRASNDFGLKLRGRRIAECFDRHRQSRENRGLAQEIRRSLRSDSPANVLARILGRLRIRRRLVVVKGGIAQAFPEASREVTTDLLDDDGVDDYCRVYSALDPAAVRARLNENEWCIVARGEGTIVGCLWCAFGRSFVPYLDCDLSFAPNVVFSHNAWVDPQWQGQGVAQTLMAERQRRVEGTAYDCVISLIWPENYAVIRSSEQRGDYVRIGMIESWRVGFMHQSRLRIADSDLAHIVRLNVASRQSP